MSGRLRDSTGCCCIRHMSKWALAKYSRYLFFRVVSFELNVPFSHPNQKIHLVFFFCFFFVKHKNKKDKKRGGGGNNLDNRRIFEMTFIGHEELQSNKITYVNNRYVESIHGDQPGAQKPLPPNSPHSMSFKAPQKINFDNMTGTNRRRSRSWFMSQVLLAG